MVQVYFGHRGVRVLCAFAICGKESSWGALGSCFGWRRTLTESGSCPALMSIWLLDFPNGTHQASYPVVAEGLLLG